MLTGHRNDILSKEVIEALASDILSATPAPEVANRMKSKLMNRVRESKNFRFMFADQGQWSQIHPGVQIKSLRQDGGRFTALIKMEAQSIIPHHHHGYDEEVMVLEGDATIEGILCRVGDYHYANAGCAHSDVTTESGCLLYVRYA